MRIERGQRSFELFQQHKGQAGKPAQPVKVGTLKRNGISRYGEPHS